MSKTKKLFCLIVALPYAYPQKVFWGLRSQIAVRFVLHVQIAGAVEALVEVPHVELVRSAGRRKHHEYLFFRLDKGFERSKITLDLQG